MTCQQWQPQPPPPGPVPPRKSTVLPAVVVFFAVLVVAGGAAWFVASDGEESAVQSPAAPLVAASSPPVDGGMFTTPEALISAAAGSLPCGDMKEVDAVGAVRQVWCGGDTIVIRIYEGIEGVNDQIVFRKNLGGGDLLTGQNWTIAADDASILPGIQAKLGGQLLAIPEP